MDRHHNEAFDGYFVVNKRCKTVLMEVTVFYKLITAYLRCRCDVK